MSTNLFEQATRQKLRFESTAGLLSVEDLWVLPLESANKPNLDAIAVELNRQLKGTDESFVSTGKKNKVLDLKFEIVKYIIEVRVAENTARLEESARLAKRTKLAELIARKQDQSLENMSLEELIKLQEET